MGRVRQTLERRQLGIALRRLRVDAGRTRQEAADRLGKVRSRIAELEDGKSTVASTDLAALLDYYKVDSDERSTVHALAAEARKRQPKRPYTDVLPRSFQRFADMEAGALRVCSYEASMVPGLLQSRDYVRAIMSDGDGIWWSASDDEVEQRTAARVERQTRILESSETREMHFIVTEEALRAVVGSAKIRNGQLTHLIDLIRARSQLQLQVLPVGSSNPARGGGFTLFDFGDQGGPVGFCSATFGPSMYFDGDTDVELLGRAFRSLSGSSLNTADSLVLIERLSEE